MQANALFHNRPPLWLYHEHPYYQWKRPEYMNLCLETVLRHCGKRFRVIQLTRYNIYNYLPDLRKDIWVKCSVIQRKDLIKWELLSRYGGLCLDPDVLVTGDLMPYIDHLQKHDLVTFGCGASDTNTCPKSSRVVRATTSESDTTRPSDWAIASRPQGTFVNYARSRSHWLLDNDAKQITDVPELFGKVMLWQSLQELSHGEHADVTLHGAGMGLPPWSYIHIGYKCGSADSHGELYTMPRLLANDNVDEGCFASMRLVPLHSEGNRQCEFPPWFVEASREQLLGNPHTLVGKLWRWSLLDETPFHSTIDALSFQTIPSITMPRYYASSNWTS